MEELQLKLEPPTSGKDIRKQSLEMNQQLDPTSISLLRGEKKAKVREEQ